MQRSMLGGALIVVLVTLVGCSGTTAADGPRKQICGHWIGRAELIVGSGPFYVDAAGGDAHAVTAAARSSGTWVQVSGDCAHGVHVSVSNSAVIGISDAVTAKDGTDIVVLVQPRAAGRATLLEVQPSGATSRLMTFAITRQRPVPHDSTS